MAYPSQGPAFPAPAPFSDQYGSPPFPPARPRKFQNRLWVHLLLFTLTLALTTLVGAAHYYSFIVEFGRVDAPAGWYLVPRGLWYSGSLLAILGAHEFGHYLLCRRYDVDASLP